MTALAWVLGAALAITWLVLLVGAWMERPPWDDDDEPPSRLDRLDHPDGWQP